MVFSLVTFAIFAFVFFIIFLFYEYGYKELIKKGNGRLIRIFLYESVGGNPVFLKTRVAEEKNDEVIGAYLFIKGLKIPMKRIANSDFIQDKVYGKCLHVVKFAEDDFRPIVRLNGEEWFRKETTYLYDEVEKVNEESEEIEIIKTPILDKDKSHKFEEKYVKYSEPLGINQIDRDVLSFNLMYKKRAKEKFEIKEGNIAKYLPYISVAVMGMIILMGFIYMTKSMNETQVVISATWDDNAKKILDESNNPSFIENIAKKVRQNNDEANAPPT